MTIDLSDKQRIAISGAHKVGKTVLTERLSSVIGLPVAPEFARGLLDLVNSKVSTHFNLELAIFHSHLFTISCLPSFIADRSIFDVLAYSHYFFEQGHLTLDDFQFISEQILPEMEIAENYYDIVLLYNLYNSYTQPTKYQMSIDNKLRELLAAYSKSHLLFGKNDIIVYNDKEVCV